MPFGGPGPHADFTAALATSARPIEARSLHPAARRYRGGASAALGSAAFALNGRKVVKSRRQARWPDSALSLRLRLSVCRLRERALRQPPLGRQLVKTAFPCSGFVSTRWPITQKRRQPAQSLLLSRTTG